MPEVAMEGGREVLLAGDVPLGDEEAGQLPSSSSSGHLSQQQQSGHERANTTTDRVNVALTLSSAIWAVVCLCMFMTTKSRIDEGVYTQCFVTLLSILVFLVQAVTYVDSMHKPTQWKTKGPEGNAARMSKLAMITLLVQTFLGFFVLMTFLFHAVGLNLQACFLSGACVSDLPDQRQMKDIYQLPMKSNGQYEIDIPREGISQILEPVGKSLVTVTEALPLSVTVPFTSLFLIWGCIICLFGAEVCLGLYVVKLRTEEEEYPNVHAFKEEDLIKKAMWFNVVQLVLTILCAVERQDTMFFVPLALGTVTLAPLVYKYSEVQGGEDPVVAPDDEAAAAALDEFRKCYEIIKVLYGMVAFAYVAGLSGCFMMCDASEIWPSRLCSSDFWLFILALFSNCFLSALYCYWIHILLLRSLPGLATTVDQDLCQLCDVSWGVQRNKKGAIVMPCNHFYMCAKCAKDKFEDQGQDARCDICSLPVTGHRSVIWQ